MIMVEVYLVSSAVSEVYSIGWNPDSQFLHIGYMKRCTFRNEVKETRHQLKTFCESYFNPLVLAEPAAVYNTSGCMHKGVLMIQSRDLLSRVDV